MTTSINSGGTAGDAANTQQADGRIGALRVTSAAERLRCLREVAGPHFIALEHTVYDMLAMLSADYQGGFWHYYRLSNGGFYMAPSDTEQLRLVCEGNGFDGAVSADAAGLVATAMAYSHLSFRAGDERFGRAYDLLSRFIAQHAEARTIHAALD